MRTPAQTCRSTRLKHPFCSGLEAPASPQCLRLRLHFAPVDLSGEVAARAVAQDGKALAMCQAVAGNHLVVALAVHAKEAAHCPSKHLEGLSSGLLATLALSQLPIVAADDPEPMEQTESPRAWTLYVFGPFETDSSL
mmetsp:Transcript_84040/g.102942  ORF Transcript_84040/g.102942 Transcript_84040/m.102942 type:complete len:138 (-) Transcript_84040:352-765(-)